MEQEEIAKQLAIPAKALVVGNDVFFPPWKVSGQDFHFNYDQTRFMYFLQENHGDIDRACRLIGKPIDWATKFIASRKFREFRNAKIAEASVRNGLGEWWWEYGVDGAKGYRECYEAHCSLCKGKSLYRVTEAEMTRDDEMGLHFKCKTCLQDVDAEYKREDVKPTREQVQFWSELGNRLAPKIERVQHSFTDENFVFTSGE